MPHPTKIIRSDHQSKVGEIDLHTMELMLGVLVMGMLFGICCNYYIASKLPPGIQRLSIALPLICIYFMVPWKICLIHLRGISALVFMCLGSSKVLLFCYDKGPLTTPWAKTSCLRFIIVAIFPLNISPNSNRLMPQNTTKSALINTALLLLVIYVYLSYKSQIHDFLIPLLFICCAYFGLSMYMSWFALLARPWLAIGIEPVFNRPYLSSSLADFWGRRWNLTVSKALRQTVYDPVLNLLKGQGLPYTWARAFAVVACFTVSAVFHELIFHFMPDTEPSGRVFAFFAMHGFCVAAESAVKRKNFFVVPKFISVPVTVSFVYITGCWLLFPPIVSSGADVRMMDEFYALLRWCVTLMQNITRLQ